ncbi:hypothetical protein [Quatrionicoccus australiensis]|uniref:hypothetical protein n=1 Tax=Quatrionicoccus australiensis TaxID=138118 RepID=UPI001CFC21E8|nr:hypothetical protein [Quatrionicoccus australiensis]MCB4358475.1 hypothetical protein [Quatrionicoccus australiensis]
MALTEEQLRALEALESMDDFARMDTGVEPIGPYKVLREFIESPIAQPASAPSEQKLVALPFAIFDQEMADLRRFHECSMDNEGYDVPKDRMKRLAEIGLVRRVSANYYEHTNFGLSVLDGDFDTSPQPDYKAQRDALLKCLALIDPKLDFSGWENGQGEDIGDEINAAIASVKGGA